MYYICNIYELRATNQTFCKQKRTFSTVIQVSFVFLTNIICKNRKNHSINHPRSKIVVQYLQCIYNICIFCTFFTKKHSSKKHKQKNRNKILKKITKNNIDENNKKINAKYNIKAANTDKNYRKMH